MRDKVTLTKKCIAPANYATDEEDEPATFQVGGFSKAFRLAVNLLRVESEETYRSLEALLKHTPTTRDELGISESGVRIIRQCASGTKRL